MVLFFLLFGMALFVFETLLFRRFMNEHSHALLKKKRLTLKKTLNLKTLFFNLV